MTRYALAFALAVLLCLPAATLAQSEPPQPASAPAAKIGDVAWIQGYWEGRGMGGEADEAWLAPKAGVMPGVFRLFKPDGTPLFYELLAIEEFEGSLRLVVKHFHPDWVGWEEKDKALKLRLTAISPGEAKFGGIQFLRTGADSLTVNVDVRSRDGVKTHAFTFRRKPA